MSEAVPMGTVYGFMLMFAAALMGAGCVAMLVHCGLEKAAGRTPCRGDRWARWVFLALAVACAALVPVVSS